MTVTVQTLDSKRQVLAGRNLLTLPDSVMMYVVIQDLPGLCTNIVQLVGLKLNMRNIKDNQYGLWWWCVLCTVSGLAADWFCLLWSCFDKMNTDYLNRDVEQTPFCFITFLDTKL